MKFASGSLVALFSCAILGFSPVLAATISFNQNLIINGDAESDVGSSDGAPIGAVKGFASTAGNFTVVKYGAVISGFPLLSSTDPGPSGRGLNYFAGGPPAVSIAHQVIDISTIASSIDLGSTRYQLSGFLGGWGNQGDNVVVRANFLNSANAPIGFAAIGPVSNVDRGNVTSLLPRLTAGDVPMGTRSIDVSLAFTRTVGTYNDGFADNLSLTLAPVPVPAALWLFGSGLAAVASLARRRTNKLAS